MPGPIQSAISSMVRDAAQTAVDVKRVTAQEKTAAELEATRKQAIELHDIQSRTEAGRSYVANVENAVSSTLDKVNSLKKYDKLRPSEKLQKAISSVAASYYDNPSKIIERGYAAGDINPKTGQKYTEIEYANAIHDQLFNADNTIIARTMRQQEFFGESKAKRESKKKETK